MTKIRSVGVFSAAKVNALLCGILGLMIAPFFLLGPGLAMVGGARRAGFGGVVFFAAVVPFFYAVIGFLSGALMAFLYNAISHAIGGIEVELDLPPPTIFNVPPTPSSTAPFATVSEVSPPTKPGFE